ncbi:StfH/YfcO family fimbrial adhesin [Escherichia fergusonii]|uniref:StfH/YfcO family fimbrial adhesin n=2 Tax=Escherichia fergusonii TaxID=564 RepID=UPI000CF7A520|nr:StfH/YfcO family fimbrial adhesin [Escherichia fergusonii]EFL4480734.1 DUF2544 domain-containing protein [Escherichia fergusonii]MBA5615827.1 DUF2544 domain-containing protein [Escherichia fergusonii]MBA5664289.1 DUF2544 domain-containing protein [Escherichia fergusonii]MBA8158497.1 DUF2544 domain-containing protein [Escherichia fergusonii]MBA8171566.1 DUF2544 domain-containing protein [Escherichia fergusonii]
MKKMHLLFSFILSLCGLTATQAKLGDTFNNVIVYYATYSWNSQIEVELTVATLSGVYYGRYYSDDRTARTGLVPMKEWSGPEGVTAPKIYFNPATIVDDSYCPGINDVGNGRLECGREPMTIVVDGTVGGCPWIVSTKIKSYSTLSTTPFTYIGPQTVQSSCAPIPLAPYDVSWNEERVIHDKVVRLQSTGGIIEKTLSTFLMKDGRLCDGSKFDEDGAYCRYVSQQMSFSSSGCDNNKVTVTSQQHPVTDKQLHDMILRVDTSEQQPIDSTCRFTYILNML